MEQSTFFSPSSLFSGPSGRRGCTTSLLPSPSLSSLLPRSCNPYRFQGKKDQSREEEEGVRNGEERNQDQESHYSTV